LLQADYIFFFVKIEMMHLKEHEIKKEQAVADIVAKDYRTADVFRRHSITYCCAGKYPLQLACDMRGIDADKLKQELETATRTISISPLTDFNNWDSNFLVDYLLNVHHHYLDKTLPETQSLLKDFVAEHLKKFPYLEKLEQHFNQLVRVLRSSMTKEEEEIFPYIRQVTHAHKHKEPYAGLFIRTLRKPVEEALFKGHEMTTSIILSIRKLTDSYTTPENVCLNHKVVIAKLKELDNDLAQHIYLEESVLFPKVLQMEKDLLEQHTVKTGTK
jgi:regulator of cell morphogenesis and NO signaling